MLVGFLFASASAALVGVAVLRDLRGRQVRALLGTGDSEVEIAVHVAKHEAAARGHTLASVHLLYGLLQDEVFVAAIDGIGGDHAAIEDAVLAALDEHARASQLADTIGPEGLVMIVTANLLAKHHERRATRADLWNQLSRHPACRQLVDAGGITAVALLFALVHGEEPRSSLPRETAVHVVLRNDDYTTVEIVVELLREIFGLDGEAAKTLMLEVHHHGRGIAGRYDPITANAKVEATRERARASGYPLWVGVEVC